MKPKKLKCGCKVTVEGYLYSECKYHETHCHFGIEGLGKCKRKLKENEHDYCKEHQDWLDEECKDIDAFGGSDF